MRSPKHEDRKERRRKGAAASPSTRTAPCCEISALLRELEASSEHLRVAKREVLLFLKSIVDRELEEMASRRPKPRGARRSVTIRQV